MLPKWHVLLGFLFAYIIYWFTSITIFQAILIFLSAVLIDFDHYLFCIIRNKDYSLKNAYSHLKKIHFKKHKPTMMIFHTIEFLIFIAILSFYFDIFIFIFIGMLFHSITDIIFFIYGKILYDREFSLIRYLLTKDKNKYF